jgi:excisionase family DNA binding protein
METPSAVKTPLLGSGPLLRPEQAAHELSVKTSWVYEAVRAGRLPCLRVGRHIRFTRDMLEGWLTEQIDRQESTEDQPGKGGAWHWYAPRPR